jgi:hypothetical protein
MSESMKRREFLASTARFAAAITVLGLTAEGSAQAAAPDSVTVAKVKLLKHAIRTGSMTKAVGKYGAAAKLTAANKAKLMGVSNADLVTARELSASLGEPLGYAVPCYARPGGCKPKPDDDDDEETTTDDDEETDDETADDSGGGGRKIGIIIF